MSKQHDFRARIASIANAEKFGPSLEILCSVDLDRGQEIRNTLGLATEKSSAILLEEGANPDRLQFALLQNECEIQQFASPYRQQELMMAQRENQLRKFASGRTQELLSQVTLAFQAYFNEKREEIESDISSASTALRGVLDASKKALEPLNRAKKGAAKTFGKHSEISPLIDTRSAVEKALADHLDPEKLAHDVEKILEEAHDRFKADWEKFIDANAPDIGNRRDLANAATSGLPAASRFELGAPEATLLTGLGAAVAGTLSLAAGWHTITYALVNVFPPLALFAVIAAVSTAFATKGKAQERRIKVANETIEGYVRSLMALIYTEKLEPLGNTTMLEFVERQNREIVEDCLSRWWKAIAGNLNQEHYRQLVQAADAHLESISEGRRQLEDSRAEMHVDCGATKVGEKSIVSTLRTWISRSRKE